MFAQLLLVAVSAGYFGIAIPILLMALYGVQNFYLRTSRQLRLLDLEAKAPIYSHFMHTQKSLSSIRTERRQSEYQKRNIELLDLSQRPFYLLYSAQRWLTLVLDLIVAGMAVTVVTLMLCLPGESFAGDAGVALTNIMSMSMSLRALMTFWTQLETSIGAVSRVRDFERDMPKASRTQSLVGTEDWPRRGELCLDEVTIAAE